MFRTINQSPTLRKFWMSKIRVDGNNLDFSHGDSCLRNDASWQIGLIEYSIQLISMLDKLLSFINNENDFKTEIKSFNISNNIFQFENKSLWVLFSLMFN